jgi:hypothetical protein
MSFCFSIYFAVLILSGCQSNAVKGHLNPVDPASLFSKPVEKVAVFPVQNASQNFMILYSGKGSMVERAVETVFDGKKGFAPGGGRSFADPQYAGTVLTRDLGDVLRRKGYGVANQSVVDREYFRVSSESKAVTPFELSLAVPVDAFLMLTVTYWNSNYFVTDGKVDAAFEMVMVRANDGTTLWTKKIPKQNFALEAPQNSSFTYRKRQEEMIESIARDLMKDFPKAEYLNAPLGK